MTLQAEIVTAIKRHMAEHQIRHRDIADALGCTPNYVTNILTERPTDRGGRSTIRALQQVLDVLGLDVRVEVRDRKPAGVP